MMDPIHQFNIEKIFTIGHIGGQEIAFTNSSAYMLLAVVLTSLLMLGTGRKLVPGRMQSVAEIRRTARATVVVHPRRSENTFLLGTSVNTALVLRPNTGRSSASPRFGGHQNIG